MPLYLYMHIICSLPDFWMLHLQIFSYLYFLFCNPTDPLWIMYSVIFPFCTYWALAYVPGVFYVWAKFVLYLYSCFGLLSKASCASIGLLKPIVKLFMFIVICLYFCIIVSLLVSFVITLSWCEIWGFAPDLAQPCWMWPVCQWARLWGCGMID